MLRAVSVSPVRLIFTCLTLSGCQAVLSLADYQVSQEQAAASSLQPHVCRTHDECPGPGAGAGVAGPATATFCTSKRRCAQLQSPDCSRLAGPERDDDALVLGAVFATSGPDAALELARQHAVQLAVEELNERGGIPVRDVAARARSLLLIGCDAAADLDAAATHLSMLGARAVVGLSDSEQFLQVVRAHGIPASMLTMSVAIAPESINSLLDADLAWLMTLTVEQRAPLLETALSALEQHVRAEGGERPMRLGLLFRYDGAGRAAVAALRSHQFDGIPLGVPELHAGRVRLDQYPNTPEELSALVASYRDFAPDIIVMLAPVDAIGEFMTPLEQALESAAISVRPHYLFTEAAKGPVLLELARQLPSLRERVHGLSAAIPERSQPVWGRFAERYRARFDDELAGAPRVAAAYDAVYGLAYAIATIEPEHEVGGRIAQALHWLEAPEQTAAPVYEVGPDSLMMSLPRLVGGERIAVYGAAGELHWDGSGGLPGGALELWCLEASSGELRFGSAPLSYDVATQRFGTRSATCDPWLKPLSEMRGLDERTQAAKSAQAGQNAQAPSNGASPSQPPPANDRVGAAGAGVQSAEAMGAAGAAAPTGASGGGPTTAPAMPAMPTMPTTPTAGIACGALSCQSESEQCCVAELRPLTGPVDGDLSCQPRGTPVPQNTGAAGMAAPPACALSLQCASDADCAPGSVCCADTLLASCKAAQACSAEMGRRISCKSQAECPEGTQCCLHSNAGTSTFAYVACETACDISNAGVRLCSSDLDCQVDSAANVCNPSALLPALRVCWPRL